MKGRYFANYQLTVPYFVSCCRWEPHWLCSREQQASRCSSVSLWRNWVSLSDRTAPPSHQSGRSPAAHQPNENIWQLWLQGGIWSKIIICTVDTRACNINYRRGKSIISSRKWCILMWRLTQVLFLKSILLYLMFWPHIKMKKWLPGLNCLLIWGYLLLHRLNNQWDTSHFYGHFILMSNKNLLVESNQSNKSRKAPKYHFPLRYMQ